MPVLAVVNVELHGCSISFICVKTIAYVHPNPSTTTPCSAAVRKSGSKMQHVTIGACALSARTYNAEVQGSDARLRNHFEVSNVGKVLVREPPICYQMCRRKRRGGGHTETLLKLSQPQIIRILVTLPTPNSVVFDIMSTIM